MFAFPGSLDELPVTKYISAMRDAKHWKRQRLVIGKYSSQQQIWSFRTIIGYIDEGSW
jgi:hypothetical protein